MKSFIRPAARRDVLLAVARLLDEGAIDAALRFGPAVKSAVDLARKNPRAGSPRPSGNPRLEGLRTWPVPGFEDVRLYYLVNEGSIRILRVLHGRRNVRSILRSLLP